ncbi:hypothetical protein SKAU_G00198190 [Synaphobranchus kaupii]|uniref:Uncharacterized protein n=1 Tax=Synaphobranchus kaupii TaxID=118154 RepID=A0A9Q1IY46_SYNKA|nr:hypothetical protein SKAU_G00198190 [Synaphobranchus kaupii]
MLRCRCSAKGLTASYGPGTGAVSEPPAAQTPPSALPRMTGLDPRAGTAGRHPSPPLSHRQAPSLPSCRSVGAGRDEREPQRVCAFANMDAVQETESGFARARGDTVHGVPKQDRMN